MRSVRHRSGRARLGLAIFIDRTCLVQRSPSNDLVAQKAALSALHLLSPAHSSFFGLAALEPRLWNQ